MPDVKNIQILGPFGSGSNLVYKILTNSLKQNINVISPGSRELMWKHEPRIKKLLHTIISNPNTLFIICYRSLCEWIASIKKESYDLTCHSKRIIKGLQFNNINFRSSIPINLVDWCTLKIDKFNTLKFKSIFDVYFTYYNNYVKLINKFPNVICLSYNKLLSKDRIYDYLMNKLNRYNLSLNKKAVFETLNKPSKGHGHSVKNSEQAKCASKLVKNKFNNREINIINKNISNNKKVFNYFNNQ